MKNSELREKNIPDLNGELTALLKAHCSLRMQIAMRESTKTSELRKLRRDIARVRTILHEKA